MHQENTDLAAPAIPGLGHRIAKIADLVGGKKNLARAIGISESQLYRYISGDSHPTVEPLAAIARCGSVRLDWLVLGEGPTGLIPEINDATAGYSSHVSYVEIEEYAADGAAINQPIRDLGRFSFNRMWLTKCGLSSDNLRTIRAHGDAMAPTIDDGDVLLVDISQTKFNGDAIYLLHVDQRMLVAKRIQHTADNGLVIVNDNHAYRDQRIAQDQKDTLNIVGKVIWAGGMT